MSEQESKPPESLDGRRLILLDDIAAFANKDCRICRGAGVIMRATAGGVRTEPFPCGCAARRFRARYGDVVGEHLETNSFGTMIFWKPGHGPVGGALR